MNILIVSHGIPSATDPQWGCFEFDQARALQALGHDVSMVAVDGRFRKILRRIGLKYVSFDNIDTCQYYLLPLNLVPTNKAKRWLRERMMLRIFHSMVERNGMPDLIYAHYMFGMQGLAKVRCFNPNIPIVGIEHWSELNQPVLSKSLKERGKIAYNSVDRLLAVSESLKSQIKKHFNKDAEVVYDMLGEEFVGANIWKKHKGATFRFVSVGSLYPGKGFNLLIDAFDKSGLSEKNCSLAIIGDGGEHGNLQKQIEACGLVGSVTLMGRMDKKQIITQLRQSDVFVLASLAETFGVVYIEAMSQGLPVIATACGGPNEFVNESNGILIPTGDVETLTTALIEMYDNCERYDNAAIADECNRRFAPQNIAKQLEKIFYEEIEKKKQLK